MKIIVLAGGLSTERNVALTSGTGICRALRRRGHRAVLVDMFLGLESYTGKIEDIFDAPDGLCADHSVSSDAPDLEAVRRSRRDQSPSMLGQGVLQVCAMADLVFLALHGSCGEDGRIQATLDLLGVPYTGSNYVSSGMAMDKAITKRFMDAEGIRTAPWHDVRYTEADIPALVEKLETPCAVCSNMATMWWWKRKSRAGRSRWLFWVMTISPPWRSSLKTPISTMNPSIRRAAPWKFAPPLSRMTSGSRWARRR